MKDCQSKPQAVLIIHISRLFHQKKSSRTQSNCPMSSSEKSCAEARLRGSRSARTRFVSTGTHCGGTWNREGLCLMRGWRKQGEYSGKIMFKAEVLTVTFSFYKAGNSRSAETIFREYDPCNVHGLFCQPAVFEGVESKGWLKNYNLIPWIKEGALDHKAIFDSGCSVVLELKCYTT